MKMEVSSIAEQLLFTTVRIKTRNPRGEAGIGTGFLFDYSQNDEHYPFLVTNKHVVSNAREGLLTFIKSGGQTPLLGDGYTSKIDDFEKIWFEHSKQNVDVAITPFVPILKRASEQGILIFFKSIPSNLIPNDEELKTVDAIEEVLFIGYPEGIWDPKNMMPVVRRGITATPVHIDFQGEKQFLVDAPVFPGSSGSPVFIYSAGTYWDKASKATVAGHRCFFVGILSEVFMGAGGVTLGNIPVGEMRYFVNLGIVFKAQTILETIEGFLKSLKGRR